MARKIILKQDGLTGSGNAPDGYKYLGDSSGDISEKVGATVSPIGGGSYFEYTEFTLDSLTIKTDLEIGVGVLYSPLSNQYYDIDTVILEYKYGGIPYVFPTSDYIVVGNYHLSSNFLTVPGDRTVVIKNPWQLHTWDNRAGVLVDYGGGVNTIIGMGLDIRTYTGSNPTNGNGSILVKIWYNTRTMGTEL